MMEILVSSPQQADAVLLQIMLWFAVDLALFTIYKYGYTYVSRVWHGCVCRRKDDHQDLGNQSTCAGSADRQLATTEEPQ